MTGDALPYPALSKQVVEAVVGDHLDDDLTCEEIVAELQKTFVPFFIIPDYDRAKSCERRWRDLFGDNVLTLETASDVCFVTAGAMLLNEGRVSSLQEALTSLSGAGMPADRQGQVARSLTPFADVIFHTR